jgi:single-strand DNA-binding protein
MLKTLIIGNLGKDCVVNQVNGKSVINFTVAHSEKFQDAQGVKQERTTWVDCSWWTDKLAIAPYLLKGTQVYVEGQPNVNAYAKRDGTPGASLTLRVQNVQLLGSPRNADGTTAAPAATGQPAATAAPQPASVVAPDGISDDLPF